MNQSTTPGKGTGARSAPSVRASISFPPDLYRRLEELAREKKVSLAWIVRDAAEQYVRAMRSHTDAPRRQFTG